MTAEVGVDRHKIAYFGDVMNATARLEGLCRATERAVLISEALLARLPSLPDGVEAEALGPHRLRGRSEAMVVHALSEKRRSKSPSDVSTRTDVSAERLSMQSTIRSGAAGASLDLASMDPPRGTIPSIDHGSAMAETSAIDGITCFGLRALFAERQVDMNSLRTELRKVLGDRHAGHRLFDAEDTRQALRFPRTICRMVVQVGDGRALQPEALWWIGIWSILQLRTYNFARKLIPVCAVWLRERWHHAVENQTFRMSQPSRTVPPIRAALSDVRTMGH
ncbi:nucleotidyl cyclase domain-containing protein [Methylorubrum aminovorans]